MHKWTLMTFEIKLFYRRIPKLEHWKKERNLKAKETIAILSVINLHLFLNQLKKEPIRCYW